MLIIADIKTGKVAAVSTKEGKKALPISVTVSFKSPAPRT